MALVEGNADKQLLKERQMLGDEHSGFSGFR